MSRSCMKLGREGFSTKHWLYTPLLNNLRLVQGSWCLVSKASLILCSDVGSEMTDLGFGPYLRALAVLLLCG